MNQNDMPRFEAKLHRAMNCNWTFVVLPREVSDMLPRRGRTSVEGFLNGQPFQATLDPDGQLSHWLKVSQDMMEAAGVQSGQMVTVELTPMKKEPEPELPLDLEEALAGSAEARKVWDDTTTLARFDWIHWITSAKQAKTRAKRIADACDMLVSGKRRVCCFDPSGFYSKAFRLPVIVE